MASEQQSDYMSSPHTYKSTNSTDPIAETYTPPRTPTASTTSAHDLFAEIQSIHTALSRLPNLSPGTEINALLTDLVNLCITPYSPSLVSAFFAIPSVSTLCSSLRPLCAVAEGELEKYWAARICQVVNESAANACSESRSREELLNLFPYYQNYIDLSRLEASAICAFLPAAPRRIAFVGSGPLPLTSLCMLERFPDAGVHNVDRDEDALGLSRELCSKLGVEGMTFGLEDVTALEGEGEKEGMQWNSFEVVFLAALVGMDTASKMEILGTLAGKMRPGALVVARSARGLREVLYPVLELSEEIEKAGLEVLAEVHPWTKVVNSVVVMRVKER